MTHESPESWLMGHESRDRCESDVNDSMVGNLVTVDGWTGRLVEDWSLRDRETASHITFSDFSENTKLTVMRFH